MLGVGVVLSPASPAPVWRLHCWRLLSAECCCWASHNLTSVSPHWPGPSLLPSLLQPPDSCPHGRAPEDWRLLLGLGHEGDQPGRQGVPGRVRRSAPAQLWCVCSYQVIILQEPSSWWCSAAGPSPRARSPSASRATSSPSTGGGYLYLPLLVVFQWQCCKRMMTY